MKYSNISCIYSQKLYVKNARAARAEVKGGLSKQGTYLKDYK